MTYRFDVVLDSAEVYHADPSASASRLNKMRLSPAHMKFSMDNLRAPTPAMIIGSATHSAILEPDLFKKEWGVLPPGHGSSKAVKEAKAELTAEFGADHILKPDAYDTILGMRDSVFANPYARKMLDDSESETSHYWNDEDSGVDCKARIDAMPWNTDWEGCVVDVKTTTDASPNEFQRSAHKFGYHIQAAHYLEATENRDRFIFIVVEKAPPHCVAIYELDDDAIALGRSEREWLLDKWAACQAMEAAGEEGAWPGFPQGVQELSLPGWAYTQ